RMIRLTDEQWERIRSHFPEEHIADGRPGRKPIPHRANRCKPPTQDRRRLTRYMRRWLVERFFAWIQWQRRILVRWEYHTQNFLGFVQLACLVILFRRF